VILPSKEFELKKRIAAFNGQKQKSVRTMLLTLRTVAKLDKLTKLAQVKQSAWQLPSQLIAI
jgi:hypothetical protein